LEKTLDILNNLIVYPKNMEENLYKLKGLMLSEAVMMHLGEKMGRLTAHEVVYETCMKAYAENITMLDALMKSEKVTKQFKADELKALLEPHKYTGLATVFVDRVLAKRPKKQRYLG